MHEVVPQPGGRSLIVQVGGFDPLRVPELLRRLDAAKGRLREEIAAAINRKRTPHLLFMIAPRVVDPRDDDDDGQVNDES